MKQESLGAGPLTSGSLKTSPNNSNVQPQLRNTDIQDMPLYRFGFMANQTRYCLNYKRNVYLFSKEYIKSGEQSKVGKSLSSIESPTISLPGNNYFSFICALPKIVCVNANIWGFPGGSVGKEAACSAEDTGDAGATPGSGRSLGEGNGNLLQYSSLGNSTDKGPWWARVHGVAKSHTCLSDWAQHSM